MPREPEWTVLRILEWTASYFRSHNIDSPRLTADILLAHCLNIERIRLYIDYERPLNKQELASFKELIKRRITHEPVAYITGSKEFWSMDIGVTPDVLIPGRKQNVWLKRPLMCCPAREQTPPGVSWKPAPAPGDLPER